MAGEVVTIVLQTVRDLLMSEIKFLSSVSKEVGEVQTQLTQMQSFLKDADSRQIEEERIRNLVKEIRRLAYRIENVLETYAIEVASREEGVGIQNTVKRFVCILGEGKSLHKVGSEIENIKTRLSTIRENFLAWGVTSQEGGQSSNALDMEQRQTYPHKVEEYFVGMKKDREQLVSLVTTDEEQSHRVISIHGMGGLGKTTLARIIYNHVNVRPCYQGFAWVSISRQFKKETIFRSLLKQLLKDEQNGENNLNEMDERELVEKLYNVQKERKCLVVLDDLWDIKDWELLSPAFPFKEANSKILMTTRNRSVAEIEFAYELGYLSEDEGWDLLQKTAFSNRSFPVVPADAQVNSQFEEVGRKMVRKCRGLPLAISVLGGILREEVYLHDWQIVSRDVETYLRRSDSQDEYGRVYQVLALSYDSLPSHLKPCFLYLGHFREDEVIDVEMLYQMWIAEGMILPAHRGNEQTSLDVAEYYLSQMVRRSMVQVKANELSITRKFKSCHLHDLLRDFCLVHGGKVEFLQLLDFGGTKNSLSDSLADNPCRYSIHDLHDVAVIPELYRALKPIEHLRSLLLHTSEDVKLISFPPKICDLKSFKFLRVLNIVGYTFKRRKLPKAFMNLIHLRFLRLYKCKLDKVQTWIGNLPNLQTIDLRANWLIKKGPSVWWKSKQLKHLYLPSDLTSTPARVYGLTKLETLGGKFFCNEVNLGDFSDLISLRHLHVKVCGDRTLSGILDHLRSNNHKLEEVWLHVIRGNLSQGVFACINLHHLKLSYTRCNFRGQEPSIRSNLIELDLKECRLEGDWMETLGKLSNLRSLTIRQEPLFLSQGSRNWSLEKMICHPKCFPELRYLTIKNLHRLKHWEVFEGAMPRLSYLVIEGCEELQMIPEGLSFTEMKELKTLMPEEFNDRMRVIDGQEGVDFQKISRIPFVSLTDILMPRALLRRLVAAANN